MPGRRRELPTVTTNSARLLVVGPESEIREEIVRLAAAAGLLARTATVADLTGSIWSESALVVIDAGCVDLLCAIELPRRTGVLIVTTSPPGSAIWSAAVGIGVEQVLELPGAQTRLIDRLAEVAAGSGPLGILVAVVGGSGGAGASTLAAALALTAADAGGEPVLLGADPWDGGIDVALGAEDVPGPRWPDLASVSGRLSSAAILDGLPLVHGVRFLSSDRSQPARIPLPALAAVVTAALRTGGPVIVDLPRGPAESARWLSRVLDLGLVAAAATVPGALAARTVVGELGWTATRSGLVVRPGLGRDVDDAALAAAVGLPVLLRIREDARLVRQRQRGEAPGPRRRSPLGKSCSALWQLAADRHGEAA